MFLILTNEVAHIPIHERDVHAFWCMLQLLLYWLLACPHWSILNTTRWCSKSSYWYEACVAKPHNVWYGVCPIMALASLLSGCWLALTLLYLALKHLAFDYTILEFAQEPGYLSLTHSSRTKLNITVMKVYIGRYSSRYICMWLICYCLLCEPNTCEFKVLHSSIFMVFVCKTLSTEFLWIDATLK